LNSEDHVFTEGGKCQGYLLNNFCYFYVSKTMGCVFNTVRGKSVAIPTQLLLQLGFYEKIHKNS